MILINIQKYIRSIYIFIFSLQFIFHNSALTINVIQDTLYNSYINYVFHEWKKKW